MPSIEPFRHAVDEAAIADLRDRLARVHTGRRPFRCVEQPAALATEVRAFFRPLR